MGSTAPHDNGRFIQTRFEVTACAGDFPHAEAKSYTTYDIIPILTRQNVQGSGAPSPHRKGKATTCSPQLLTRRGSSSPVSTCKIFSKQRIRAYYAVVKVAKRREGANKHAQRSSRGRFTPCLRSTPSQQPPHSTSQVYICTKSRDSRILGGPGRLILKKVVHRRTFTGKPPKLREQFRRVSRADTGISHSLFFS